MIKSVSFPGIPPWLTYGVLYFISAYSGLWLATLEGIVSPVWFAAGFALAGVLLHGYRVLPGIWLGGFSALLLYDLPLTASLLMALGSTLEALLAGLLLRRLTPTHKLLTTTRYMIYFLVIAAVLSPLPSATIGIGTLFFHDIISWNQFPEGMVTWWVGDAGGNILITPLILAWRLPATKDLSKHIPEAMTMAAAILLVCGLVFGGLLPELFHDYPSSYLPFPVLAWAVLRFELRTVTLSLLLVAGFALLGSYAGMGPFIQGDLNETMILLQIYIVTLCATALMTNAIVSERQRATGRLALASRIIAQSPDGIIMTDPQGIILSANPAFFTTTGFQQDDIIGNSIQQLTSVHHNADFFSDIWRKLRHSGQWEGEIWNRNVTGEIHPQWLNLSAMQDPNDQVSHYIGIYSDVSRQKKVQERIRRLAYYDVLTGLPNRQLFADRLDQAMKYAGRHTLRLALFFLDLDRFKNINDTLGHTIGDKVLQLTTDRLNKCVRQTDILARLGGDEFTLVVQDVDEDFDAILVAEKVVKAFRKPIVIEEHELFVTPSIGISLYPNDGSDSEQLIKHADTAMYRAKELGGNGFQFFAADMSDPIRWNLTMENALRRAMEEENLKVVYQPQFDLLDGSIIGLEALARWHHKGIDETAPEVFIKVAEDTGLIHRLGDQVLEIACNQIVQWQQEGLTGLRVAVNISALQLRQHDFGDRLRRIVKKSGVSPQLIELEITETALMENAGIVEDLINLLSVQGFRIAVDDFGTGYSSLGYLKRLAIDRIKIDRLFVKDVPNDQNDSAICRAIISMAHNLNLRVIAEGVENNEQMDFLRHEHCDEVQGYIFSKPVNPNEVVEMIHQGYWHTAD